MQTINIDEIKPASDAVQAAFKAWREAGLHEASLREKRPSDVGGMALAKAATGSAGKLYDQALKALAETTRLVIASAESE